MDSGRMISGAARWRVFFASFFIQAAWSFNKMQGLGFAAAISPALHEIHEDEKKRQEAYKRHTVYYNAHPYMASPILGAAIHLEEMAAGGSGAAGSSQEIKDALMGTYGSIGDGFFWGALRPLAALIGIASIFLLGITGGVIVFLFLYNIFHLAMRWKGLVWGEELGIGVIEKIGSLNLPQWSVRGRYLASVVMGLVSFFLLLALTGRGAGSLLPLNLSGGGVVVAELVVVALALLLSFALQRRFSVQFFLYPIIILALIFGVIFL